MSAETETPSRLQYLNFKKKYPDSILLFRLGDFYETFDEDALITSKELDLVLTHRGKNSQGKDIPMAGIPYHAIENYIARLIDKGYHVTICEQLSKTPVNGLCPREVTRIITPGTVLEPGLLKNDANNFLFAIAPEKASIGIAYVDISTGEFFTALLDGNNPIGDLQAEITRLHPAEVLIPEGEVPELPPNLHLSRVPAASFDLVKNREILMEQFEVATLAGFGIDENSPQIAAAGAIIQYLRKNQKSSLQLLHTLTTYSLHEFMTLDSSTRRNLELTETLRSNETRGSLLGVLDHTVTPVGKRMMRQWVSKPLINLESIRVRQNALEAFVQDGMLRAELREQMRELADMERLINRITAHSAVPRDLVALRSSICLIPTIRELLEAVFEQVRPAMQRILPLSEPLQILESAIAENPPATLQNTGVIRPGYSDELDNIILNSKHAREYMANLESVERERTGIKTLKVSYNKVFGYYIEISRAASQQAPENYIRKQTLVNAERFITPEMKEYETLILNAEEQIHAIESRLFTQVCNELSQYSADILETARSLGTLDVLLSLAEAAAVNGYTRPVVNDSKVIAITGGRHPVVEQMLGKGQTFIPNDVRFEDGEIIRVITGPNMSGKSTFLRQTAIIILMAQMGSFVPAEKAEIGLVDRIFTRIGAQDEIHAGLSTFMVEMVETANILNNAGERSLLILDEIGRGTSTYDGVSIAWAIVEYIHNAPRLRARTLFATHYHELTRLADTLPGVRNYNVAVSESGENVVFLHKIVPGAADKSYGIHVAQIAGLPKPVVNRANEILAQLENGNNHRLKEEKVPTEQLLLFPETNPIMDALKALDVNAMSPIEAINTLYTWKKKFE